MPRPLARVAVATLLLAAACAPAAQRYGPGAGTGHPTDRGGTVTRPVPDAERRRDGEPNSGTRGGVEVGTGGATATVATTERERGLTPGSVAGAFLVTGRVTDQRTGGPLGGALVAVVSAGWAGEEAWTGPDGTYRLSLPAGTAAVNTRLEVEVRLAGYLPARRGVRFQGAVEHRLDVPLAPEPQTGER